MKSWNGLDELVPPRRPDHRGLRTRALVATFATCVLLVGLDQLFPDVRRGSLPMWNGRAGPGEKAEPFQWSKIYPSRDLQFHDCFGEFQCAKLSVPLDHFNGTHPGQTVSIAITMLPARVSVDDPHYGGPVLLNPGGPGGAGAMFNVFIGKGLQAIVDPPTSWKDWKEGAYDPKFYDMIGFDPRGVGETEPFASCLPNYPAAWTWALREAEEGIIGSSDAALSRLWSKTHAWGASCKAKMEADTMLGVPSILQYMTTAFVARDMLEIVEKHASYVTNSLAVLDRKRKSTSPYRKPDAVLSRPSEAKLNYWGFSYGSFLGNTFASMYPDRVGRVVLDGIVSAEDYINSLGNGSLTDTEKAARTFSTYCLYYGPRICRLAKANATVEDVEERVESIVQSLYHDPIPIVTANGPEVLTYSDLKGIIFSGTYAPQGLWPILTQLLLEVEARDGILIQFLFGGNGRHEYVCPSEGSAPIRFPTIDATIAILCSDGIDQSHVDMNQFMAYWDVLEGISPLAGSIWATLMMRCASWKIKASHKFEGPFGGNTSNPILFVSNTADPVTPLRSGRLMHSWFPNSGLLVSDHAGHCSLSHSYACPYYYIKQYFQTGELPAPGTLCIPPPGPFSLNSTDPKSPFYDPSLGKEFSNRMAVDVNEYGRYEQELSSLGQEVSRIAAEHDLLGLGNVLYGEKAGRVMQNAAKGLEFMSWDGKLLSVDAETDEV